MNRYIRHISTMLAAVAMTATLGSCSTEDIDAPRHEESYTPGTQLVINLAVPQAMETASASDSRAGEPEMAPTAAEGKINSLRLIAFSTNGTPVINRGLLIPEEMPVNPDKTAIYEIKDIKPGDYRIYLVANLENYVTSVKTEAELKQVIVNMEGQNELRAGNLPMVYEPAGTVTIPSSATTNPAVALLSLKFACVKVKYDLLFDKDWNSDIFGNNGMVINDVTASNVAKSAYLVTNKTQHAATRDGVSGNGSHYDDYAEVPSNANVTGKNVVTVLGNKVSRPSAPTDKWAYEGVIYLPERYAADKQTTLNISATVTDPSGADGTVRSRYTIPLGGYDGDEDCKELPRGTYYEVIAKIKTLGDAELDATIVTKDWMEELLPVDMVHTFLTLSKDAASVKSLEDDVISYDTDGRGSIGFECESLLPVSGSNRNPAVIAEFNTQAKTITFRVNPAIDITTLPEDQQVGTADCYITAGNIRKLIRVDYDIKPFFTITPLAVKIQWNTEYEGLMNTKIYEYTTNLNGIRITTLGNRNSIKISKNRNGGTSSATDQVANSNISLSFESGSTYSKGRILVKALKDPGTTTVHYFGAYPEATGYDNLKQDLQVTVMPPLGDYHIYFRAINDYQKYNGGQSVSTFLNGVSPFEVNNNWPTEDYNSYTSNSITSENWNDWWNTPEHHGIYNANHRIYIYTQIGETTSSSRPKEVWHFNHGYNDWYDENSERPTIMTGDNVNPGWYHYKIGYGWKDWTDGTKEPEPGKTLMIFHAHQYQEGNEPQGFELHRASHHNDPGIPLFDYEDREGWILYDPTAEPYYRIYDDKPYIEDVTFTIYSTEKVTGWWNKYGVATNVTAIDNPNAPQWTMSYNMKSADYGPSIISNGKTYYASKIKLKCAHGDYEKAIKLDGLTSSGTPMSYAPAIPSGYVRVYYRSDQWGNDVPKIYVYSGSDKNAEWGDTPSMTLERVSGGKKYYYYDVRPSLAYGNVIFQTADRKGQDPASGGYQLSNQNMIYKGANQWTSQSPSALPTPDNDTTSGVILFGGRSFESYGHVGTYENGVWKGGRP